MNDHERQSRFWYNVQKYVMVFLTVGFVVTCCMLLFLNSLQRAMGLRFTEENIQMAAKLTFGNVMLLTTLFVLLDGLRRRYLVQRPVQQILQAVGAMDEVLKAACAEREEELFSAELLERELWAVISPRAKEKRQQLSIDLRGLRDMKTGIDGAVLTRVLLNLLSNAVKYTQEGGEIALRGQIKPGLRPGQAQRVVVVVRDNGMGMKPEFLAHVYEENARAKESMHIPGRGLGLSIVRRLVQQMGGTIGVRSEWGKGTVFTVSIPCV